MHFSASWSDLDYIEFLGYLGILTRMAVHKDREEPLSDLFSMADGKERYRKLFSYHRFRQISRSLHFDDVDTRSQRREHDKFCPIREIWNMWVQILPMCFSANEDVTVDEQLVSFKGRCSFRQYMPMKPAKYGLKFFMQADPVAKYVLNVIPYLGKNGDSPTDECSVGESIVLSLTAPIFYSGRTIVADNFFTSLKLATKLLQKKLTYLGTIRPNKRELPPCVLRSKTRALHSTTFVFFEKNMLTSYVKGKNKAVILLSSGTTNVEIDDSTLKKKPVTILHYNRTKGGVDTIDRMLASVSVRRFCRRWPMVTFYNMVDLSLINAFSIYKSIFDDEKKLRRQFLKEMAKALYEPLQQRNEAGAKTIKKPKVPLKKTHVPLPAPQNNFVASIARVIRIKKQPLNVLTVVIIIVVFTHQINVVTVNIITYILQNLSIFINLNKICLFFCAKSYVT